MILFSALLIYVFCIIAFLVLWYKEYNKRLVVTPFLLFGANEISQVWSGAIYALNIGYSQDGYAALVAALGFAAWLAGFALFRQNQSLSIRYINTPVLQSHFDHYYRIGFISLTIILLGISLYQYRGIPPAVYSLSILLGGFDTSELANLTSAGRYELTKAQWFGGTYRGQGILSEIINNGWTYLLCLAMIFSLKTSRISWKLTTVICFVLAYIFIAGNGTRGPLVWTILIVVTMYSLIAPLKPLRVIVIILILFILVIMISLTTNKGITLLEGNNPLKEMAITLSERIYGGNGFHSAVAIEFANSGIIGYRHGALHLQKAISSLPGIQYGIPFSNELWQAMHSAFLQSTYFASATYISTVYVDFGLLGVVIIYFFLGAVLSWSYKVCFWNSKEIINVVLISFVIFFLGRMSLDGAGPIEFIASSITLFAIHLIFTIHARLLSKIVRRNVNIVPKIKANPTKSSASGFDYSVSFIIDGRFQNKSNTPNGMVNNWKH